MLGLRWRTSVYVDHLPFEKSDSALKMLSLDLEECCMLFAAEYLRNFMLSYCVATVRWSFRCLNLVLFVDVHTVLFVRRYRR